MIIALMLVSVIGFFLMIPFVIKLRSLLLGHGDYQTLVDDKICILLFFIGIIVSIGALYFLGKYLNL